MSESLFSNQELERLFSPEGDRIDVSDRVPSLPPPFFVEIRPGKATLFCPGAVPGSSAQRALDQFAIAPVVVAAANASTVSIVRGKDFVDIGPTKYQGLLAMQSLPGVGGLQRDRLCIGDSENDAGIFAFCREAHAPIRSTRFFVGADRRVVGDDPELVHFERGFVAATASIFETLAGDQSVPTEETIPDAWRDTIRTLLSGRPAHQLLAITDMTGCHLYQAPRVFPPAHRENIRRFIRAGGLLWLVSGDALPVIHDHFIQELGDLPDAYFVISSGGYQIDEVKQGRQRVLWTATELPRPTRMTFLNEAVLAIRQLTKSANRGV